MLIALAGVLAVIPVPEPSSFWLLAAGLAVIGALFFTTSKRMR